MSNTSLEERERKLRTNLPLEIVLVRHAEPDWESARARGGGDPGLTELGRQQAATLAVHLNQRPLQALYCSPLARARETAAAIGQRQDLQATVVDDLAEIRIPELPEASQTEIEAYFTAAARRPFHEYWNGFPDGEPFRAFHARVTGALESTLAHHGARPIQADEFVAWTSPERARTLRVGIVAHGGANSVMLTHLLGIESVPWEWIRFETPLAAYSVVGLRAFNEQGYIWSLQSFGRRIHGAD